MFRLICNLPEYNIRIFDPLKAPQFQMLILLVVKGVIVKCFVDFFNILRLIITNKTNVPADLYELLSTAKNLPEYNIRIFDPLKAPQFQMLILLVVIVVKVVIEVRVNSKRSAYLSEKIRVKGRRKAQTKFSVS